MEQLTGIGWSIITLGIMIGIGIVLLSTMGSNVASCGTGYSYQTNGTTTYSTQLCCNTTASTCTGTVNSTNPSTATQNLNTIYSYLGTTNGGLASWIPLVIILVIGLFFLGAFMVKKGKNS